MRSDPKMSFAVDTGGTFTDLVVDSGGELHLFKALTTPDDPVQGVLDVLDVGAAGLGMRRSELLGAGRLLVHGTTRAINALVTGATAPTAFLTTRGHPDVLLFREGGRADPFNFSVAYPEPLVPRSRTFEVAERVAADGTVVDALDEAALVAVLDRVRSSGAEAVGVSLLWSIVNPVHELRVGKLIAEHLPGIPFTLSHQLNPTIREYRRASSTCIDASLKPLMTEYFAGLDARLRAAGFPGRVLVVTSQGGMLDAAELAAAPIHSINSGPAMAPVAGRFYARQATGRTTAIVADTGGTTFDVSVVRDGHLPRTSETWLGPEYQGHITGFPSVDVTSVGAGGGSVAWVDDGGMLRVGPRSAASNPGPACYGRGGLEATVTDAAVLLGYIDPGYFLGGTIELDRSAAQAAIARAVATPLGLTVDASAAAILRIATENMVHAIEELTVDQGIDPRHAVLVGGGGAAGLNLVAIARHLECAEVLIPETVAALSASGALLSDLSADFSVTHVTRTDAFDHDGVRRVLAGLTARCEAFAARSATDAEATIEYAFEGRYLRQNWDLEAPLDAGALGTDAGVLRLAESFHRMHERVFAIAESDAPVQVTTWRARVCCPLSTSAGSRVHVAASARTYERRWVHFQDDGWTEADVRGFEQLAEDEQLVGPAVIESPLTTVVIDPGFTGRRTAYGSLVLEPAAGSRR